MEGEEEAGEGGLAASRGADEGGRGAGLEGQGDGGEGGRRRGGGVAGRVGEGEVGEGDGAEVPEPDVARVLVGGPVGEVVGEAEEAGRRVAARGHLRDEGDDVVDLGHAEEEHREDGQDGVRGGVVGARAGGEDGAVVEDEGRREEDARFREPEEEARVGGAPESHFEGLGGGLAVLFAQVAFEGEGAYGADVAECFREDCVGRSGGVVASPLPAARDAFEGPSDGVHERCGRETHRGELPA